MRESAMLYYGSDERNCSKCHKIKGIECFETAGNLFKTCNLCRDRARMLAHDTTNHYATMSSSSASAESVSASYFVPEPEAEPEPNIRKKVRGLADM